MQKSLPSLIVQRLKSEKELRLSARQIAEWVFETQPQWCETKKQRSAAINSDAELLQQIVAEIGSQRPRIQKRYPQLKTTADRPKKYYWSEKSEEQEIEDIDVPEADQEEPAFAALTEKDMYPLLGNYLFSEFGVYSKRIDERRSSNTLKSGSNKWLFPDLVCMEDIYSHWHGDVQQLVDTTSQPKARLWSVEAKLKINRANLRQVYFQAVSNSTWANFGYLVSAEVTGDDTMSELRMLHGLHGIGLILLDTNNPDESQIVIPATERADVDWATCSRLAKENSDFRKYLTLIRQFYLTGDPRREGWST